MLHVTGFFAGILAFLYIGLSFNVIRGRYAHKLILGDGGHDHMVRRIRVHANFAEYIPFALILMGIDEINGSSHFALEFWGIVLVIGRVFHAYSLLVSEIKRTGYPYFRSIGMVSTFGAIIALAIMAL